ncbi:MAG: hypothetical protein OEU32_18110, partial [Acidimicrobiia bacterium]|nr:hypothetical protein [Acidimicrobiia bacterium]
MDTVRMHLDDSRWLVHHLHAAATAVEDRRLAAAPALADAHRLLGRADDHFVSDRLERIGRALVRLGDDLEWRRAYLAHQSGLPLATGHVVGMVPNRPFAQREQPTPMLIAAIDSTD